MSPPRLAGADARRHLFGLNEINQRLRLPVGRGAPITRIGALPSTSPHIAAKAY